MVVNLSERGIDEAQADNLRARLSTFAEDWELPEMAAYDAMSEDFVRDPQKRNPTPALNSKL